MLLRLPTVVRLEDWAKLPLPAPESPQRSPAPVAWAYCHEADEVDAHLAALDVAERKLPSKCEAFLVAADDTRFATPTAELLQRHSAGAPPLTRPLLGFASTLSCEKAKRILHFSARSFRRNESEAHHRHQLRERHADDLCSGWSIFQCQT